MKKWLAALALLSLFAAGSASLAGDDRDRAETARKLLAEKGITCQSLAREYEDILRDRKLLQEKYSHIETAEEAKAYIRDVSAIRERVLEYESRRSAFEAAYPIIPEPPKPLSP